MEFILDSSPVAPLPSRLTKPTKEAINEPDGYSRMYPRSGKKPIIRSGLIAGYCELNSEIDLVSFCHSAGLAF